MTKKPSFRYRPHYSYEQKQHAVHLVREQSLSITQVCKDFNISKSALHDWLKQYDAGRLDAQERERLITPEQQCIRELERRNKQLEQDVAILKKASAFFARALL